MRGGYKSHHLVECGASHATANDEPGGRHCTNTLREDVPLSHVGTEVALDEGEPEVSPVVLREPVVGERDQICRRRRQDVGVLGKQVSNRVEDGLSRLNGLIVHESRDVFPNDLKDRGHQRRRSPELELIDRNIAGEVLVVRAQDVGDGGREVPPIDQLELVENIHLIHSEPSGCCNSSHEKPDKVSHSVDVHQRIRELLGSFVSFIVDIDDQNTTFRILRFEEINPVVKAVRGPLEPVIHVVVREPRESASPREQEPQVADLSKMRNHLADSRNHRCDDDLRDDG